MSSRTRRVPWIGGTRPAATSALFERPRDAISPRIHVSMNAICATVASSRLSARTCRAIGRPRASSMIASIRRPVEARRTRSRFRRTILHLRILLDGLPRHTKRRAISRHGALFVSRSLISCCNGTGFVIPFLPESRWNLQFGKNTEVRAGPAPSSHRSDETDQNQPLTWTNSRCSTGPLPIKQTQLCKYPEETATSSQRQNWRDL